MKTRTPSRVIAVAALVCAAPLAAAGSLSIEILGLDSSEGQAVFVVMDSERAHRGKSPVYAKRFTPISERRAQLNLSGLPAGEYSAVVYHDVNGNGELDRHFFGMPTEPYGFSNDARGTLGIPPFAEARFEVGAAPAEVRITVE